MKMRIHFDLSVGIDSLWVLTPGIHAEEAGGLKFGDPVGTPACEQVIVKHGSTPTYTISTFKWQ